MIVPPLSQWWLGARLSYQDVCHIRKIWMKELLLNEEKPVRRQSQSSRGHSDSLTRTVLGKQSILDSLRIFPCPWFSGACPKFVPYTSANREHLNTLISLYTNWFQPRKDNRLYLSGDAAPVCWWVAGTHWQQILSILNYAAVQTIVNMLGFVRFNAALWGNAVFM